MKRSEPHPSLDGTLRRLLWSMLLLVCVILVATLAILLLHNQQYSLVTANIVRASQFNQNFKEEVDLKMYYYVIDSSYGSHVMYLDSFGEPYWKTLAANQLKNDDYSAWLAEQTAAETVTEGSGMKYVGF